MQRSDLSRGGQDFWHFGALACLHLWDPASDSQLGPLDTLMTQPPMVISGRECTVVGTRIGAYPAVRDAMSFIAKVQPARLPFIQTSTGHEVHFGSCWGFS